MERLRQKPLSPNLIILDTFARCFVGGDENKSQEVGEFINAMSRLQKDTGASILLVHHTGKDAEKERGSSALRAAADAMFKVSRRAGVIVLENDKQKDDAECSDIHLRLKQVEMALGAKGETATSCVVINAGVDSQDVARARYLKASLKRAWDTLKGLGPATSGEWRKAIHGENGNPVAERTFQHWREALLAEGRIERNPSSRKYTAIDNSGAIHAIGMQIEQVANAQDASHATTPEGVARRQDGAARSGWQQYEQTHEAIVRSL